jgi:hypothetical protein
LDEDKGRTSFVEQKVLLFAIGIARPSNLKRIKDDVQTANRNKTTRLLTQTHAIYLLCNLRLVQALAGRWNVILPMTRLSNGNKKVRGNITGAFVSHAVDNNRSNCCKERA